MIRLDETLSKLRGVLSVEQEQRRINGLAEITGHKLRRTAITQYMADIEGELEPVRLSIRSLPSLPNEQEIQWAQAIMAMNVDAVRFLEVDTTGLSDQDEIVRIATVDLNGTLQDNILVKPSRPITAEASAANGLTDADVLYSPDVSYSWKVIRASLYGHYVLSFSQAFDRKKLDEAAARHQLPPIVFVGDDLQRHCTQYYNREYYLTLAELCERIGHPLESTSAVDRAEGQYHILQAMAEGFTDVRPPRHSASSSQAETDSTNDDGLLGLDEHPF